MGRVDLIYSHISPFSLKAVGVFIVIAESIMTDRSEDLPGLSREALDVLHEAMKMESPVPMEVIAEVADSYADFFLLLVRLNFGALGAVGTVLTVLGATQAKMGLIDAWGWVVPVVLGAVACLFLRQHLLYRSSRMLVRGRNRPTIDKRKNIIEEVRTLREKLDNNDEKEDFKDKLDILIKKVDKYVDRKGIKYVVNNELVELSEPEEKINTRGVKLELEMDGLRGRWDMLFALFIQTVRKMQLRKGLNDVVPMMVDSAEEIVDRDEGSLHWGLERVEYFRRRAWIGFGITALNFVFTTIAIYKLFGYVG